MINLLTCEIWDRLAAEKVYTLTSNFADYMFKNYGARFFFFTSYLNAADQTAIETYVL